VTVSKSYRGLNAVHSFGAVVMPCELNAILKSGNLNESYCFVLSGGAVCCAVEGVWVNF